MARASGSIGAPTSLYVSVQPEQLARYREMESYLRGVGVGRESLAFF